jgi:hypothetical protein
LALAGWLIVLLAEPAYHSSHTRLMLSGPDTRTRIRQWLAQEPAGTRLTQAPGRAGDLGVLTPLWVHARQNRFASSFGVERLHAAYASLGQRQDLPPIYSTFEVGEAGDFATANPDEAASPLLLLGCDHPLCGEDKPPAELEPFIHWQSHVSPGLSPEAVFDHADWYFVPIGGWDSARSSGPSIRIGQIFLRLTNPTPTTQAFFQLLDHLLAARQATDQKNPAEALDHYRQILDSPFFLAELFAYSFLYDMYLNAGVLSLEQGDPTAAISCWKEAAQTYPERPDPPYRIALAYSDLGQWLQAIPYFRQAIARDDKNGQYHYNLGVTYLKLDRPAEATAAFEACVVRKPDADAYVNLGVLYGSAGQRERARAALAKALELAPNHPQAAALRRELQANP